MEQRSNDRVAPDKLARKDLDLDDLMTGDHLERRIASGEITRAEADELLQMAARRRDAEQGPDNPVDPGASATESGFGTGQGMASQSTRHGKSR